MNIHEKRAGARKFPAGRFRAQRIWRTRRLRVTAFYDRADLPAGREALRCSDKDAFEIRDVAFDHGPWVPIERDYREAYWRACGVRMWSCVARFT